MPQNLRFAESGFRRILFSQNLDYAGSGFRGICVSQDPDFAESGFRRIWVSQNPRFAESDLRRIWLSQDPDFAESGFRRIWMSQNLDVAESGFRRIRLSQNPGFADPGFRRIGVSQNLDFAESGFRRIPEFFVRNFLANCRPFIIWPGPGPPFLAPRFSRIRRNKQRQTRRRCLFGLDSGKAGGQEWGFGKARLVAYLDSGVIFFARGKNFFEQWHNSRPNKQGHQANPKCHNSRPNKQRRLVCRCLFALILEHRGGRNGGPGPGQIMNGRQLAQNNT